ncbi:Major facilitator superfamily domain-containing protein 3 [Schistosoma japonicum]|nr:Major facilitator superfamily domain-containing protein 3 [Schistosoma japonicum]KAH8872540.1 Major facilitator superfamily domain-containing protein 3 [Schistosoma japonicum]KAH8872541.1 Major facilitator superfamily domain-containing protein 3 [Schistosoma japonicum]KAH8872542.1 Major facilitator superfamily domain-containing protein 3 [Schistosoma japonicum]
MYSLVVLFYLYLLEGIPYGVQSRFLPLIFRNKGVSLTSLGLHKLLHIPWLFKSFYAPVIDRHMNKRFWLFVSFSGLFFCTVLLLRESEQLVSGDNSFMYTISACLFMYNFWAASQDITVDSLTLSILKSNQLSLGNTIQVVGYKCGAIIGGGFLTWLSAFIQISYLFVSLACLYASGMCFCLIGKCWRFFDVKQSREICIQVDEDESSNEEQDLSVEVNQYSYTKAFKVALRDSVGSRCLIVLLLMYKLGEQGSMNMLPLMLFDRGFSLSKVGFWTGVVGQLASIIGSTSGYYIQNKLRSPLTSILCLMIIRACLQSPVTLIAFESVWIRIPNVSFWIGCLFMNGLLFVSGAITTTMFTLMMHCTRSETSKEYQATHYCILSSAELLGKLIFGTIAAYFTDVFGYGVAYLCFLLLSLLPIQYVHRNSNKFRFCP